MLVDLHSLISTYQISQKVSFPWLSFLSTPERLFSIFSATYYDDQKSFNADYITLSYRCSRSIANEHSSSTVVECLDRGGREGMVRLLSMLLALSFLPFPLYSDTLLL